MVSAIGSSYASGSLSTPAESTAAIEDQIVRYRKELSNCLNCESAQTKQGQADIQVLTNKINSAEARLNQINTFRPGNQSAALNATTSIERSASVSAIGPIAEGANSGETSGAQSSADTQKGRLVDVTV